MELCRYSLVHLHSVHVYDFTFYWYKIPQMNGLNLPSSRQEDCCPDMSTFTFTCRVTTVVYGTVKMIEDTLPNSLVIHRKNAHTCTGFVARHNKSVV